MKLTKMKSFPIFQQKSGPASPLGASHIVQLHRISAEAASEGRRLPRELPNNEISISIYLSSILVIFIRFIRFVLL
jgi:hypothetical protein